MNNPFKVGLAVLLLVFTFFVAMHTTADETSMIGPTTDYQLVAGTDDNKILVPNVVI